MLYLAYFKRKANKSNPIVLISEGISRESLLNFLPFIHAFVKYTRKTKPKKRVFFLHLMVHTQQSNVLIKR